MLWSYIFSPHASSGLRFKLSTNRASSHTVWYWPQHNMCQYHVRDRWPAAPCLSVQFSAALAQAADLLKNWTLPQKTTNRMGVRVISLRWPYKMNRMSVRPSVCKQLFQAFNRVSFSSTGERQRREAAKSTVDCSAARGASQGYCDSEGASYLWWSWIMMQFCHGTSEHDCRYGESVRYLLVTIVMVVINSSRQTYLICPFK